MPRIEGKIKKKENKELLLLCPVTTHKIMLQQLELCGCWAFIFVYVVTGSDRA